MLLRIIPITLAALLLAAPAKAAYMPPDQDISLDDENSNGPAIVLDLFLVRPLGVVATLLGTAVFVVGLPIEAATGDIGTARYYLIEEPARYTFQRPLGDITEKGY